jgi:signal transduction histidine kinase
MNWLDKPDRTVSIKVIQPAPQPLPDAVDSGNQYALIHFADNGAGVPLENKTRIFDAFFTTRDHGTGLGLALVRRIIEGHEGVIRECGVPGLGADFEIYLPTTAPTTTEPTRLQSGVD